MLLVQSLRYLILVSRNISGTLRHTLSDHKATYICIHENSIINILYKRKIRDYKNANFALLKSLIKVSE